MADAQAEYLSYPTAVFGWTPDMRWRVFRIIAFLIGCFAVPVVHSGNVIALHAFWQVFFACGIPALLLPLIFRWELKIDLAAGTYTRTRGLRFLNRRITRPVSDIRLVRAIRNPAVVAGAPCSLFAGDLELCLFMRSGREPLHIAYGTICSIPLESEQAFLDFGAALAETLSVPFDGCERQR